MAQLGRRVSELKIGLAALESDGGTARSRDDLRRRMHALGSAARVLKFQVLADEMGRLEQTLLRTSAGEALGDELMASMRADLEGLVALAWGEAADSRRSGGERTVIGESVETEKLGWPATALVVGDATLAEGLLPEMSAPGDAMLDCERIESTGEALEMARALAPDVVVLDAELEGSQELVERLASDPLTEPVPVVVVGSFATPEKAARWVALGVARVLARPYTPRLLQEACASVIAGAHRAMRPEPFGQLSMTQLVDRLALELRRGLCDSAVDASKLLPVSLGDGHEVMAALWSAIVRIREVATIRSRGAVRFQPLGPEGAVAVASWSSESRSGRPPRGVEEAPRLEGRTVLVADDDPSVTWFLSGVLRAAGASVIEAHDGEAALHKAYRACPDLVISDIMMPKLDGFALCRAIKRDVVLRDVPVILLSWKEDLLQRVRELGANADGYLRKEASASVVLERVSEVLRPRLRVEKRLTSGGEVRGRLDDLTVRTLLALTARHQPDARVSVRDAAFLYEVEVRGGAPRSATRTTTDGRFERGAGVLFSLLGVGAGRFVVTPSDAPLRGWLDGSLEEQLRPAVAQMRAAQRLLSGSALMNVQGVDLQLEAIQPYFEASPVLSRSILDKLAEGFSPRTLLLRASHSARLLEDVLNDAILHGGVARVVGNNGEDMLPAAVAEEMLLLERGIAPSLAPPVSEAALYAQFTPSPLAALVTSDESPPSPARNSTAIEQALAAAVRHDEASAPPPSVALRVPPVASRGRSPVAPAAQPHPPAPSPASWRGGEESEVPQAVELASASDVPRVEAASPVAPAVEASPVAPVVEASVAPAVGVFGRQEGESSVAPPVELSVAPRVESSAPSVESSAPRVESSAPREESSAPREESSAPRGESSAPRAEAGALVDAPRVELELSFPVPEVRDVAQLPEPGSLSPQAQARQKEVAEAPPSAVAQEVSPTVAPVWSRRPSEPSPMESALLELGTPLRDDNLVAVVGTGTTGSTLLGGFTAPGASTAPDGTPVRGASQATVRGEAARVSDAPAARGVAAVAASEVPPEVADRSEAPAAVVPAVAVSDGASAGLAASLEASEVPPTAASPVVPAVPVNEAVRATGGDVSGSAPPAESAKVASSATERAGGSSARTRSTLASAASPGLGGGATSGKKGSATASGGASAAVSVQEASPAAADTVSASTVGEKPATASSTVRAEAVASSTARAEAAPSEVGDGAAVGASSASEAARVQVSSASERGPAVAVAEKVLTGDSKRASVAPKAAPGAEESRAAKASRGAEKAPVADRQGSQQASLDALASLTRAPEVASPRSGRGSEGAEVLLSAEAPPASEEGVRRAKGDESGLAQGSAGGRDQRANVPRGTIGEGTAEEHGGSGRPEAVSSAPAVVTTESREASGQEEARAEAPAKRPWPLVMGLLLLVGAGSAAVLREPAATGATVASGAVAVASVSPVAGASVSPVAAATASESAPAAGGHDEGPPGIEDLPLLAGETAPEGQGVLEVVSGRKDDILVDRREAGRGPEVKMNLAAGTHEVRARRKGDDQPVSVVVRAGRRTRVDLRGPWRR